MAYREYLTGEVAEDWLDGLLTRRAAIRRLVLLGLSSAAAAAFLVACAQQSGQSGPVSGQPTSPTPSAASSGSKPAGEAIVFEGPRGDLQGWFAAAAEPRGAMLVIHENRGLNDHIRSVAGRLAAEGYSALAIDLLSEEGGTEALGEGNVQAALAGASAERLVGDMQAGLDELERRVPGARLGVVGFCFGGAMVWTLLDAGDPRLAAAIPFYGPAPDEPDFAGNTAAVLGIYAEQDARVNASRDRAAAALDVAGLTNEIRTYPGVDHAFFNDTGGRYSPEQAAAAWSDVLGWLEQHLGG